MGEASTSVPPGIHKKMAGHSVQHGFGERRSVHRQNRFSANLRLNEVQAESLLFGQSGEDVIQFSVDRPDVRLLAPVTHPITDRKQCTLQVPDRCITAASKY